MEDHLLANARMYAITDASIMAWRNIFAWLLERSGVPLMEVDHPPPASLDELWRRPDLGCVLMCGWPYVKSQPKPHLLAAPIPLPDRYNDSAIYFTDFVVHRDSTFERLEDTFGGSIGWTLEESNSGFNLPRHHLLQYRSDFRPQLYSKSVGALIR